MYFLSLFEQSVYACCLSRPRLVGRRLIPSQALRPPPGSKAAGQPEQDPKRPPNPDLCDSKAINQLRPCSLNEFDDGYGNKYQGNIAMSDGESTPASSKPTMTAVAKCHRKSNAFFECDTRSRSVIRRFRAANGLHSRRRWLRHQTAMSEF